MGTLLRIGEVAALLGISTKTIRYYHSAAVLPEPARATNGYRVYSAQDVVYLQRIRRLQALGLPLKTIRAILGTPDGGPHFHQVLRALLSDVDTHIAALQARRTRITAALAADTSLVKAPSPTFAGLEAQLAPYLTDAHVSVLDGERHLWALVDAARPCSEAQPLSDALTAHLAAHPEEVRALLAWGERLSVLSDADVDALELEQLAHAFVASDAFRWLRTLGDDVPAANQPAQHMWAGLAADLLTPAQQRFLEFVQEFAATQAVEEVHDGGTRV